MGNVESSRLRKAREPEFDTKRFSKKSSTHGSPTGSHKEPSEGFRSPTGGYEETSEGFGSPTGGHEETSEGSRRSLGIYGKTSEIYRSPTGGHEETSEGFGNTACVLWDPERRSLGIYGKTSEIYRAIVRAFQQCDREYGERRRMQVAEAVSKYRPVDIVLKRPPGSKWKIRHLDDTIYKKMNNVVEEWGDFYLPGEVTMEVMGVVEDIPCPCGQLVLMTCEDKKLYAYDGEELHEVASNIGELFDEGIQYPGSKRFYRGEPFNDMTEEDWAKVRESDVGKNLEEEHLKLVTEHKSTFMKCLDVI